MAKYRKFRSVVIERLKNAPKEAHAYLQLALDEFKKDENTEHLVLAFKTFIEAQGSVSEIEKTPLYTQLRGKKLIEHMTAHGGALKMTTNEIMQLTRGEQIKR